MTKHGMRGFASGVIAASAVVALFYFQFSPKSEATTASQTAITEESVQQYLNSHGEIAVDKQSFDKWQKSEETASADKPKESSKDADKKSDDKSSKTDSSKTDEAAKPKEAAPQVYKATVQVTQGMTTSDVAATLAAQHVIKDKNELINFVVSNKLEPYLQLGTFTLSSDMTIQQIAATITKR
ncbi:MAG: hypothetical protein ACO1OC_09765 [Tuberibacillus sp.]